MDRLAAHVIATAVLTAALAAVPVAMANPTTSATASTAKPSASPSPAPKVTASASASPSASASGPARPSQPAQPTSPQPAQRTHVMESFPCADVRQLGDTSYARWHGVIAFSVKLYYSPRCRETYGYAFPWLQFRLLRVHYDLGMGVFDVTHDAIDGARTFIGGAGGPDFWSSPVTVPAGTCTQALAHVFYPDTETDTFTAKFCI